MQPKFTYTIVEEWKTNLMTLAILFHFLCVAGFSLQHGHYSKQPHQSSNTQRTEKKTTDVVIQQHSRKLLMMDILMSETCWAHKKWNKTGSGIKLVFHSSAITMMHGPINIRLQMNISSQIIYKNKCLARNSLRVIFAPSHTQIQWKNRKKVFVIQMKERLEIRDILLKYVSCCFIPLWTFRSALGGTR